MPQTVSLADDYDKALAQAKAVVSSGGVLVYPTDTLYGLGCSALDQDAIDRIYGIKRRDGKKPLSMLVFDYSMLLKYCEVSPSQAHTLHALLPGPYTFILRLRNRLPVSETMQAGVRVPEHLFMRQVSRELSLPIVTTSANISGEKGAAELSGVNTGVAAASDLLIDGGCCQYAQGSTVVDLLQMKVVRKGAVRKGDKFEF